MIRRKTILIISDIHYACDAEKLRRGHETRIIARSPVTPRRDIDARAVAVYALAQSCIGS